MIKYFKKVVVLTFLMLVSYTWAQQHKNLDSLLVETNLLVYNNPELAIKKGLSYYKEAKNNPSLQVSFLLIVANGNAVLKNHDKVFEYALLAKSIADKNADYVNQIKVTGFLGGQYQRLKLKDKATEYIDKAHTLSIQHPLPDSLNYLKGNILFVKGLLQKDDLGCEYALPYFTEAVAILKKYSNKKSTVAGLAIIYNNIGGCYLAQDDLKKAEENFIEGRNHANTIKSQKSIASAELGLGEVLTAQNKPRLAISKIEQVLPIIEEIDDIALKKDAYKALSENYFKISDNKNYEFYTKAYLAEEKKLIEQENKSLNKVVNKITNESDESQENQKKNYRYLVLFLVLFLGAVLYFIYYKLTVKKKNLTKLKETLKNDEKKGNNL
jgi:hypothetical protein